MSKKKVNLVLIFIFVAAILAAILDVPKYANGGINFINKGLENIIGRQLPYFPETQFLLGLDLQGGTHLIYEADLSKVDNTDASEVMAGLRDVIERRVNYFGVQEPLIQTEEAGGRWRLVVELAGVKDVNQAIEMIGKTPRLEFREQRSPEETQKIIDKQKELEGKSMEEIMQVPDFQLAFEDPDFQTTELTGQYLKKAEMQFDQNTTYQAYIALEFNDEGAKIFEEVTGKNIGKMLAIYIDDQRYSNPVVQEKISGGKAQITGQFSVEEAKNLARNLNAGALPVPITLISQQTVGPTLGAVELEKSLFAGMIGLAAVIVFMIAFYRLPGLLASISLGLYLIFLLAIFKLIPVTLTLAGIGGVILSVGMEVDANVLIFSRMREELRAGKNFSMSIAEGFHRAWPSIRDGKLTTILVAIILFYFGTSFVRGFALTLIAGLVLGLLSAITFTRYLLRLFEGTRFEKMQWLWK